VLGDSFMQGIFIPDNETPSEHLRRHLESAWGRRVSVLNTGHIGYSLEQYYHTLLEYYDRFRPQFIVVGVCPNDFGETYAVLTGKNDWSEARYWIEQIQQFCHTRQAPCLLACAPLEAQVTGHRTAGHYPGEVANLWNECGFFFLDLTDAFVDAHLRHMAEAIRQGRRPPSPLFNGHLFDAHFSPLGAATWGTVVGRRLALLREYEEAPGE
jgi:hypothetical protein